MIDDIYSLVGLKVSGKFIVANKLENLETSEKIVKSQGNLNFCRKTWKTQ